MRPAERDGAERGREAYLGLQRPDASQARQGQNDIALHLQVRVRVGGDHDGPGEGGRPDLTLAVHDLQEAPALQALGLLLGPGPGGGGGPSGLVGESQRVQLQQEHAEQRQVRILANNAQALPTAPTEVEPEAVLFKVTVKSGQVRSGRASSHLRPPAAPLNRPRRHTPYMRRPLLSVIVKAKCSSLPSSQLSSRMRSRSVQVGHEKLSCPAR